MEKELETIISNEGECKVPEETLKMAGLTRAMCFAAGAIAGVAAIGAAFATMTYPLYWICCEIARY